MKVPLVCDFMATRLLTLRADQPIGEAIESLLRHRVSGAPVVDGARRLVGILSEKDCLRIFSSGAYNALPGGAVEQYMSRPVVTVAGDADLFTVAGLFLKNHYRRLPVVDAAGVLVGQVSRRDLLESSRAIWEAPPVPKAFTDARYLTDQIKAALQSPPPLDPAQGQT